MEKSFDKILQDWHSQVEAEDRRRQAEFDTELNAAASYHERTGNQWHRLSNTQQRNEIERYINDKN
jgi:hypothetical protein